MRELVLDTNVLVAALRSRRGASYQLIRLIGTGVFRINVSVALALESEEVLKRAGLIPGLTVADIDTFLDYIFHSSNLVPSVRAMRPSLPDPDDELVPILLHSEAQLSLRTIKETLPELQSEASVF